MAGCECCDGGCGKEIKVSFCPECKSRSVKYVFGFGNLFGVIPKMKCGNCGFECATFPVLVVSEEKLREAVGKLKKKVVKKVLKKKKVVRKKKVVTPARQRVPLEGKRR